MSGCEKIWENRIRKKIEEKVTASDLKTRKTTGPSSQNRIDIDPFFDSNF